MGSPGPNGAPGEAGRDVSYILFPLQDCFSFILSQRQTEKADATGGYSARNI